MSIWKKAISVATSAALLASLLTAVAAPAVFAGTTVTSAGNVPRGGTSAGTATFTLTENSANALTNAMFDPDLPAANALAELSITITDSAAVGQTVYFTGTPVVSAPGSLGVSVSLSSTVAGGYSDVILIDLEGQDPLNVESITISGLSIVARTGAALGGIIATLADEVGTARAAFVGATVTATGVLQTQLGPAAQVGLAINVTSACNFRVTGGNNGNATFSDTTDSRTVDAITGAAATNGAQTIAFGAGTATHPIGTTVTQTVDNCQPSGLGSPGTVVDSAIYNSPTIGTVFAGEFNQSVPRLSITERVAGYFSVGTTITFTIATTGVTFSNAPTNVYDDDPAIAGIQNTTLAWSGGALSADRKSVSFTVTAASGVPAMFVVDGIKYDVAASVPMGTNISVGVTLSGSKIIVPASRVNAVVNRVFTATAGSIPNVFIGQNAQATGLLTLTEVAAGSFTDGLGATNVFAVCADSDYETFTSPGPSAKVTAGDLRLREGAVASPDNIVQGTPYLFEGNTCYYWTVWTASTTASTIQIGNADFTTGPLVNVNPNVVPGPVFMGLYAGSVGSWSLQVSVVNANRVYQGTVVVTAVSSPVITAGVTSAAGDVKIAETVAGTFKTGDWICLAIQPRASNDYIQDTWFDPRSQNLNPVATATGGGMIVGPVLVGGGEQSPCVQGVGDNRATAGFRVVQQATGGVLGSITISNFHYTTTADAPNGPVSLRVYGYNGATQYFSSFVSNARIGVKSAIKISAVSALGLIPNQGPWSTSTKVAAANKFITWKFDGGAALAGKTVRIYVATKNSSGGWGPFVNLTGRVANASGVAEFHWRATGTWVSVRAYYAGDASYAPSWSSPVQGRWLS